MSELVRGDVLDVRAAAAAGRASKELECAVPEHDVGVDDGVRSTARYCEAIAPPLLTFRKMITFLRS